MRSCPGHRAVVLLFAVLSAAALAQEAHAVESPGAEAAKPAEPPRPILEFSFGSAQLFNRGPGSNIVGSRILATSAALLLGEWLMHDAFSLALFINIPVGSATVVANGQAITAVPDAVAALGLRWSPMRLDLREKTIHLEAQVAAFLGRTLSMTDNDTFLPVVAGRLHLSNPGGFGMYVGVSWAYFRESLALIYGLGYQF